MEIWTTRASVKANLPSRSRLLNERLAHLRWCRQLYSVLVNFVSLLHDRSFYVITYNGRGVCKSSGRASFTGLQEVKDLEEVVQWALSKLPNIRHVLLLVSILSVVCLPMSHRLIQGYSYGSLITSLHPVLPSPIKTSHILLSYPLDKRGLLTLFHSRTYENGLDALLRNSNSNVLIAFGDRDQFTGISSYEQWSKKLSDASAEEQKDGNKRLEVVYVQGASHFWERPQARILHDRIERWLDYLNTNVE